MSASGRTASEDSLRRRAAQVEQAQAHASWLSSLTEYDQYLETLRPSSANRSPQASDTESDPGSRKQLERASSLATFTEDDAPWADLNRRRLQKAFDKLSLTPQQQVPTVKKVSDKPQTKAPLQPPTHLRGWWYNAQKSKQPLGELSNALGKKIKDLEADSKRTQFGPHNPAPPGMSARYVAALEDRRKQTMSDELRTLRQKKAWIETYVAETHQASSSTK